MFAHPHKYGIAEYLGFLHHLGSSFGSTWTESDGVTVTAGVGGSARKGLFPYRLTVISSLHTVPRWDGAY